MENPVTRITREKGWNRSEFARKSGVPYVTLTAVEGGLVMSIQLKTADALARFSSLTAVEIQEAYRQWKASLIDRAYSEVKFQQQELKKAQLELNRVDEMSRQNNGN